MTRLKQEKQLYCLVFRQKLRWGQVKKVESSMQNKSKQRQPGCLIHKEANTLEEGETGAESLSLLFCRAMIKKHQKTFG